MLLKRMDKMLIKINTSVSSHKNEIAFNSKLLPI